MRDDELHIKALSSLRVVDLKEELDQRGLSKSGSKKDLVERLKTYLKSNRDGKESTGSGDQEAPNTKLSVDKGLAGNDFIKQYLAKQQAQLTERKASFLSDEGASSPDVSATESPSKTPVSITADSVASPASAQSPPVVDHEAAESIMAKRSGRSLRRDRTSQSEEKVDREISPDQTSAVSQDVSKDKVSAMKPKMSVDETSSSNRDLPKNKASSSNEESSKVATSAKPEPIKDNVSSAKQESPKDKVSSSNQELTKEVTSAKPELPKDKVFSAKRELPKDISSAKPELLKDKVLSSNRELPKDVSSAKPELPKDKVSSTKQELHKDVSSAKPELPKDRVSSTKQELPKDLSSAKPELPKDEVSSAKQELPKDKVLVVNKVSHKELTSGKQELSKDTSSSARQDRPKDIVSSAKQEPSRDKVSSAKQDTADSVELEDQQPVDYSIHSGSSVSTSSKEKHPEQRSSSKIKPQESSLTPDVRNPPTRRERSDAATMSNDTKSSSGHGARSGGVPESADDKRTSIGDGEKCSSSMRETSGSKRPAEKSSIRESGVQISESKSESSRAQSSRVRAEIAGEKDQKIVRSESRQLSDRCAEKIDHTKDKPRGDIKEASDSQSKTVKSTRTGHSTDKDRDAPKGPVIMKAKKLSRLEKDWTKEASDRTVKDDHCSKERKGKSDDTVPEPPHLKNESQKSSDITFKAKQDKPAAVKESATDSVPTDSKQSSICSESSETKREVSQQREHVRSERSRVSEKEDKRERKRDAEMDQEKSAPYSASRSSVPTETLGEKTTVRESPKKPHHVDQEQRGNDRMKPQRETADAGSKPRQLQKTKPVPIEMTSDEKDRSSSSRADTAGGRSRDTGGDEGETLDDTADCLYGERDEWQEDAQFWRSNSPAAPQSRTPVEKKSEPIRQKSPSPQPEQSDRRRLKLNRHQVLNKRQRSEQKPRDVTVSPVRAQEADQPRQEKNTESPIDPNPPEHAKKFRRIMFHRKNSEKNGHSVDESSARNGVDQRHSSATVISSDSLNTMLAFTPSVPRKCSIDSAEEAEVSTTRSASRRSPSASPPPASRTKTTPSPPRAKTRKDSVHSPDRKVRKDSVHSPDRKVRKDSVHSPERKVTRDSVRSPERKVKKDDRTIRNEEGPPLPPVIKRTITQRVNGGIDKSRDTVRPGSEMIERAPSPARHRASTVVFVRNLVRPFTVAQLKELLARTGTIVDFWIDNIKSKCFCQYESEEQAVETRTALHRVRWPPSNPKLLLVDFATPRQLTEQKSGDLPPPAKLPPAPVDPHFATRQQEVQREQDVQRQRRQAVREWDKVKIGERSPGEKEREREREREHKRARETIQEGSRKREEDDNDDRNEKKRREEVAPAAPLPDTPVKLLDDLFRKTVTTPCIYWLPLTTEQIEARDLQRKQRAAEREKRLAEREKRSAERRQRSRSRSRHR